MITGGALQLLLRKPDGFPEGAFQVRPLEVGAFQVRFPEVGAFQVGAHEVSALEVRLP